MLGAAIILVKEEAMLLFHTRNYKLTEVFSDAEVRCRASRIC